MQIPAVGLSRSSSPIPMQVDGSTNKVTADWNACLPDNWLKRTSSKFHTNFIKSWITSLAEPDESARPTNFPQKRRKKENCEPGSPSDPPSRPGARKKQRLLFESSKECRGSGTGTFVQGQMEAKKRREEIPTETSTTSPRKILKAKRRELEREEDTTPGGIFHHLYLNPLIVKCPQGYYSTAYDDKAEGLGKIVAFNEMSFERVGECGFPGFILRKSVLIDKNLNVRVQVYGQEVGKETLGDLGIKTKCSCKEDIDEVVTKVATCNVCIGSYKYQDSNYSVHMLAIKTDTNGKVRSISCPLLVESSECSHCVTLNRTIGQRLRRARLRLSRTGRSRRTKQDYQRELKNKKAVVKRAKKTLREMKQSFRRMQRKFNKIKEERLERLLAEKHPNIPEHHLTAIKEILNSAKRKSPRGNRFSDDWILSSMLLHTKSAATYRYLRDNKILPLPHPRTIRLYLSKIKTVCGFDEDFFKLLKQFIMLRPPMERHGIVSLDEISLRKGITVNTQNLTYVGLQDFGNVKGSPTAQSLDDKASHGLVIMYQSLYGNFTQPIAVFASSGPVKGDELAKLVELSIVKLEKAGASIHGVVSDGASTNKRMWKKLGCCADRGKVKNYFRHPLDKDRKVYMFSDTPHIFKNIRNRLLDHEVLNVSRPAVFYLGGFWE